MSNYNYPLSTPAWKSGDGWSGVTKVVIKGGVTSIGNQAFVYCTSLRSVIIGDSVTSIGEYAFSGCTKLASVTIGNSVETIGKWAFLECTSLNTVYYNASNLVTS